MEINDPVERLPENETHIVYKHFASSELLISVVPRREISKRRENLKKNTLSIFNKFYLKTLYLMVRICFEHVLSSTCPQNRDCSPKLQTNPNPGTAE